MTDIKRNKQRFKLNPKPINRTRRPLKQNYNEIRGFEERARYMLSIAEESLRDRPVLPQQDGFQRFIRREPLGVTFVVAAWNYPYLIAVNGVVPAILAGNTVILKHAPQTFPCAERFADAFKEAGLPDGVFQVRLFIKVRLFYRWLAHTCDKVSAHRPPYS